MQHPATAMNEGFTKPELVLSSIAILAFVGALLICTQPTIPYFWTKLASFTAAGAICVLLSRHRLAIVLATVGFIIFRLIIWGVFHLLRAR
jgi:hypothetical protein